MIKQFRIPWQFFILFMFLGFVSHAWATQNQEPPTISAQVSANTDYAQKLTAIKDRQKALNALADTATDSLSAAAGNEQTERSGLLHAQLETIHQINSTYDQQIVALERLQSLKAKNEQFRNDIADLNTANSKKQRLSFMELDRVREELNAESVRESTLAVEIKEAETALEQSKKFTKEQQDRLEQLKASAAKEAKPAAQFDLELEIAHLKAELANQDLELHQIELHSQKQAKVVHEAHLALLTRQIKFLQAHAVFNPEDLQQQLHHIDKEEFELNRALSNAKEQQATVKSRLEQTRKKLDSAAPDDQNRIEANLEALRLEFDALKTNIDSSVRRLELLANSRVVWQRRYGVFHLTAEQAALPKWRSEANRHLKQIDQEETTLKLWITDWQNRLITLTNKIENKQETGFEQAPGITQQHKNMLAIVNHLQNLQIAFENSRRLQQKLVDEINIRSSTRTLRDWLDLAIHYKIFENTLLDWIFAFTIALTVMALLFFIRWLLIRRLKYLDGSNKTSLAYAFLNSIKRANSFFFLTLAVFAASLFLNLDFGTINNISRLTKVAFVIQAAVWASSFLRIWIFNFLVRRTKRDGTSMGALSIFNFSSQVLLWSVALLLILQNLGVDVTALIAGLGIGGVAVALSLQHILSDLFSSLSIVLDKPFIVGDFVMFDDFMGNIEHIGIKTTRIRSLTGEQIICPNSDLLNTRIRNFKRMQERRVAFNIGVVYQTPADQLQKIPTMIKTIIEAQETTRFDRAHFFSYSDSSLLFESVYYVLSSDYNIYMNIQQAINLEIFKQFQAEGIEFAYPTQLLYLQNTSNHTHFVAAT